MLGAALLAVIASGSLPADASYGFPKRSDHFPIAVWLQDPEMAGQYKAAGFNLYVGLWKGPTEAQLARLKAEGMSVMCDQNAVGLAHRNDPTIVGWTLDDEPDNAQEVRDPVTGQTGYGPCIPPDKVVAAYKRRRAIDPTRPILLNIGQGVAFDEWVGRGSGAKLSDYATYVKGGDIISFDIYPVAGLPMANPENYLWYIGKGLDRLRGWMDRGGTRWNCIECTRISGERKATPAQVRSEVWMSIIHGSRGLIYFVHQFKPTFDEHALLDDPEMLAEVTTLNHQIQSMAPVINSPTLDGITVVTSTQPSVPVDVMTKRSGHDLYIFSIGMRNQSTAGSFTIKNLPALTKLEVLGENRQITVKNGKFSDSFSPYQVHIYRTKG